MALHVPQWIFQTVPKTSFRSFHTTSALATFFQKPRSGYPSKYDGTPDLKKQTLLNQILGGYQMLKLEIKALIQDIRDKQNQKITIYKAHEPNIVLQFTGDPMDLQKWVVTADADYDQGYSTASLKLSESGTGIFSGNLSTQTPKDGKLKYAGYCNITTVTKYKSFKRPIPYTWYPNTHLVLRVRGDGRTYLVNLLCKGYFDLTWYDTYNYPLYTTGGPYWQVVKLPFSKFVFTSKGTVQDTQREFMHNDVTHIGFTIADKVNGPFRLEIDSIGVEYDPNHYEKSAYEMYHYDDIKM